VSREEVALLFALEAPTTDDVPAIKAFIAGLNAERSWAAGSIELVDDVDLDSSVQAGDVPIWTLGGVLHLRRSQGSAGSVERAQLDDVTFLIDRLCAFSRAGRPLVIEYDGEQVGAVEDGEADRGIVVGLLGEWRDRLQGSE
jgi:hypothetical protein